MTFAEMDAQNAERGAHDEQLAAQAKITAADIKAHLCQSFSEADGYATLLEVANGTGGGLKTFADAVVLNLWPSRGMELIGYEIKVSRQDWLNELKQPDKAWPVMQFCDRWVLLSAPKVAKLDEIPLTWGWAEFDGKRIKYRKPAPALEAKPLSKAFVASMVRRQVRDVEAIVRQAVREKEAAIEREVEQRVATTLRSRHEEAQKIKDKAAAIEEAVGVNLLTGWRPAEEVAAALRFAMANDPFTKWSGLPLAISDVERALKTLRELHGKLQGRDAKESG